MEYPSAPPGQDRRLDASHRPRPTSLATSQSGSRPGVLWCGCGPGPLRPCIFRRSRSFVGAAWGRTLGRPCTRGELGVRRNSLDIRVLSSARLVGGSRTAREWEPGGDTPDGRDESSRPRTQSLGRRKGSSPHLERGVPPSPKKRSVHSVSSAPTETQVRPIFYSRRALEIRKSFVCVT